MTTQEKIDEGFDVRKIPQGASNESKTKKSYGNKYLQNRRSISIEDTIAERLDGIQTKREIRTKGELFKYLADLEEKIDPMFKVIFKCKKCNEEIKDIPKHININRFLHNDLCKTTPCKGFIIASKEIALDGKGFVISNKGTTTTNDESSGTTDKKDQPEQREQTLEEKYAELEENTREFERKRELEHLKKFNI